MKRHQRIRTVIAWGVWAILLTASAAVAQRAGGPVTAPAPAAPIAPGGWGFLGQLGIVLCLGLGALGSSMGVTAAAQAAAGAWAKEAREGKRLPFSYVIFVAAPISQTLYSMIVMNKMLPLLRSATDYGGLLLGIGISAGLGEMVSAWGQGLIGAAACRCLSEGEGKGLTFLIIAIGIVEAVGIFTLVFMLGAVPQA